MSWNISLVGSLVWLSSSLTRWWRRWTERPCFLPIPRSRLVETFWHTHRLLGKTHHCCLIVFIKVVLSLIIFNSDVCLVDCICGRVEVRRGSARFMTLRVCPRPKPCLPSTQMEWVMPKTENWCWSEKPLLLCGTWKRDVCVAWWFLRYTLFGWKCLKVFENERAASLISPQYFHLFLYSFTELNHFS